MRYQDECLPLVSSVDTVYYYDLRVAQLNNRNDFSPCFLCRRAIPCFLVHPPHAISQTKSVCAIEHQCVCSCSYLHYLHEYKLCRCARTRIITSSRPGTRPLVVLLCGFFWSSNRNHYLLVLVTRTLATPIHVRTYLPKFNQ